MIVTGQNLLRLHKLTLNGTYWDFMRWLNRSLMYERVELRKNWVAREGSSFSEHLVDSLALLAEPLIFYIL